MSETLNVEGAPAVAVQRMVRAGVGEGWMLLPEGTPLKPGDGFLHPDYPDFWTDYTCRPDIFRGGGERGSLYHVPKNDTAHTWPWRRRVGSNDQSQRRAESTPRTTRMTENHALLCRALSRFAAELHETSKSKGWWADRQKIALLPSGQVQVDIGCIALAMTELADIME